jgi:hypothetical protein
MAKVFASVKLMHYLCKSEDKLCDRERHSFVCELEGSAIASNAFFALPR